METLNILVIDDSPVDRMLMKKVVEGSRMNLNVIENTTGKGYMDQIKANQIKCIVLDLLLDDINGVNILKDLKSHDTTKNIPIIVCSSVGESDTIKKTLALGAYDYFEKPFTNNDMQFGFRLKVNNAVNMFVTTEKLTYLGTHDPMTNFLTRHVFEEKLDALIKDRKFPLALIMLDINGLKIINDAFGHERGDTVLRELSSIIANLKMNIVGISRWGSDEFIILIKNSTEKEVRASVQEIRDEIDLEKHFNFSVSFGWVLHTTGPIKAKYLIQKAENHLHSNKILEAGSVRSNMIETMVQALHQAEPREEMHSQRVSVLCEKIGENMGLSEFELKKLRLAGLMHDIGKIAIDKEILQKSTELTGLEWREIKKHPELGFKILSTSTDTMEIATAVYAHHENWDGSGYPKGLREESIPIMARIIAVANAFDAMTSFTTYKDPISAKAAIKEIKECSGSQFDPKVVDAFLDFFDSDMDHYTRDIFFNTMARE